MRAMLALIWFVLMHTGPVTAQPQPQTLTSDQVKNVVDGVAAHIEKLYVFPEMRAKITGAVRAANAKGVYQTQNPKELAERLTGTLIAVSNDKHLTVTFDPVRAKALGAPDKKPDLNFFDAEGLRWNQGYVRQEILPGNTRYVRIKLFYWTDKVTAGVIDAAARFLSGGSAVIIDLRGNGGGHSLAVQRMISYLLPEAQTELMTFFDGQTGKSEVTKSTVKLPSPRIKSRPVYVLIDRGSASASEEFAYHIQQFKLGTLIGETTAGAANNNALLAVPHGFVASVSYGRPIHPVSKTNWEGVGIAPDKATSSPAALDAALIEALTVMSQNGDAQEKAEAQWELQSFKARMTPANVTADELKTLTGHYGEREVRLTDGRLTVHRMGRPPLSLSPMGDDLFAVIGIDDARFKFIRKGASVVLEVHYRDGRKQEATRDPKPD